MILATTTLGWVLLGLLILAAMAMLIWLLELVEKDNP